MCIELVYAVCTEGVVFYIPGNDPSTYHQERGTLTVTQVVDRLWPTGHHDYQFTHPWTL